MLRELIEVGGSHLLEVRLQQIAASLPEADEFGRTMDEVRLDVQLLFEGDERLPEPFDEWTCVCPTEVVRRLQALIELSEFWLNHHPEKVERGEFDRAIKRWKYFLDLFGGNPDEAVAPAYELFIFRGYWFGEVYGEVDEKIIEDKMFLMSQKRSELEGRHVGMGELKVLDAGTGDGRILEVLIKIVERHDPENLKLFKKNLKAFDLVPKVVDLAKKRANELGIPEENIIQGSFLNESLDLAEDQFDLCLFMMHTLWHAITAGDWIKVLSLMSRCIKPGGQIIADSVPAENVNLEGINDNRYVSFYSAMQSAQKVTTQKILDRIMGPLASLAVKNKDTGELEEFGFDQLFPRLLETGMFTVSDVAAPGIPKQMRLIPTKEFIEAICSLKEVKFVLMDDTLEEGDQSKVDDYRAFKWGDEWLNKNGIKEVELMRISKYIRGIINRRNRTQFKDFIQTMIDMAYRRRCISLFRKFQNTYFTLQHQPPNAQGDLAA